MDSLENSPFSHLICPAVRTKYNEDLPRKSIGRNVFFQIGNSFYFSNSGDEISSNYRHHLYPLDWCNNKEYSRYKFSCGACHCETIGTSTTYYSCKECHKSYHKECVETPPLIKSLYHPKHHLQLLKMAQYNFYDQELDCKHCRSTCILSYNHFFYYCFSCKFTIDPVCARKPPVLNNRKRHEHTLNFFPRKTKSICDVCGEVDKGEYFIFVCLECDFVVHQNCIYLPFVIRISRHDHRISFTYSSPYTNLLCGVCRKTVDENYGAYTCKKGCIYAVHSKCATRKDMWDGKELEEEPEKEDENISSFEVIGDGIIEHISHWGHPMRLERDILYDERMRCHACTLPFYEGHAYKCMNEGDVHRGSKSPRCDFVLHEECANLPRTKRHMAYPSPLTLQVSDTYKYFNCNLCGRFSFGFRYKCTWGYLDLRCATISEPFDHQCHAHPLFLTSEPGKVKVCSMCMESRIDTLNCIECDFISCFCCATLPYKVRYKHDEHILTLSYVSHSWCEICEETCNESGVWLYTCNVCSVTLHIACLLGKSYIKTAQSAFLYGNKVNIVLNDGLTRPLCHGCNKRCKDKTMFVTSDGRIYCDHWELWNLSFQDFRSGSKEKGFKLKFSVPVPKKKYSN